MEDHLRDQSGDCVTQNAADEMAAYGITRVPVEYFHYRGFRYTSLIDAVAQAKLDQPATRPAHIDPVLLKMDDSGGAADFHGVLFWRRIWLYLMNLPHVGSR